MSAGDPRWCALLRRARAGGADPPGGEPPETPPVPRQPVDRPDFDPTYDPAAPIFCEICGNEMRYTAACKIQCGVCGYKRDCSDP